MERATKPGCYARKHMKVAILVVKRAYWHLLIMLRMMTSLMLASFLWSHVLTPWSDGDGLAVASATFLPLLGRFTVVFVSERDNSEKKHQTKKPTNTI
jgi:hypothetical protein